MAVAARCAGLGRYARRRRNQNWPPGRCWRRGGRIRPTTVGSHGDSLPAVPNVEQEVRTNGSARPWGEDGTIAPDGDIRRLLIACVAVMVASHLTWWAIKQVTRFYNHDVAWFVEAGARLLAGGSIPEQVFDPNPPLIFWLMMPMAQLAGWLGLPPLLVMDIITLAAIVGSCLAVYALTKSWKADSWSLGHAVILMAFAGLTHGIHDPYSQRDHLIAVLLLPYLVSVGLQASGHIVPAAWRVGLAVAAALAIALRPHYALVWVVAEAYRCILGEGSQPAIWRFRENRVIVALGTAYLAAAVVFASGWIERLPMIARLYAAYEDRFPWFQPSGVVLLVVAGLCFLRSCTGAPLHVARVLSLASLCAYAIVGVQAKNWFYHHIPSRAFAFVAVAFSLSHLAARLGQAIRAPRLLPAVGPCAVAAIVALSTAGGSALHASSLLQPRPPGASERLSAIFTRYAGAGPVLVMTTAVRPAFPTVALAGTRHASRFSCFWFVPGLYRGARVERGHLRYHAPDRQGPMERYFVEAAVEDFQRLRPAVVVNDVRGRLDFLGETGFDFLGYFRQEPAFRSEFDAFRYLHRIGGYDVYVRDGESGARGASRAKGVTGRALSSHSPGRR